MVKYAATLALLAVAVMCGTLSYSIVTVNKHVSETLMKLDTDLDEVHRLTLEAALTAMEARKASAKESKYLDQWNAEISRTLTSANTAIASISSVSAATVSTLQATQATVSSLQAPINSANRTLTEATSAISHLDTLIQDPALTATISHVASTTGHLDATAADVQQEVHRITHPTLLHKVWGALLDVAHVFNPL